jgi:WD40 repeat protein
MKARHAYEAPPLQIPDFLKKLGPATKGKPIPVPVIGSGKNYVDIFIDKDGKVNATAKNINTFSVKPGEPTYSVKEIAEVDPAKGFDVKVIPALEARAGLWSVAWSPKGDMIAVGSGDGTIRIFNPKTGKQIETDNDLKFKGIVNSVAWSPDGDMIAGGSSDKTIKVFNPKTGKPIETDKDMRFKGTVWSVAWSPKGDMIAGGSSDDTIKIFNPKTGKPIETDENMEFNDWVWSVAWSPKGDVIAGGSRDGAIRIFNPKTGKPIGKEVKIKLPVNSVAWSPDGNMIAGGSWDQIIRIFNPKTGEPIVPDMEFKSEVLSVAWSPNGKQLAVVSKDWKIHIVNIEPQSSHIDISSSEHTIRKGDISIDDWKLRVYFNDTFNGDVSTDDDGQSVLDAIIDGTPERIDISTGKTLPAASSVSAEAYGTPAPASWLRQNWLPATVLLGLGLFTLYRYR